MKSAVMSTGLIENPAYLPLTIEEQESLLSWASRERLLPLLGNAAEAGLDLDPDIRRSLDDSIYREQQNALRFEAALLRTVVELESHGFDYRVLKGLAASRVVYPDPSLRQTGDVDLLVREDDFDAVCRLVERMGAESKFLPRFRDVYGVPVPGKAATFEYRGVELDVHRRIEAGVGRLSIDASRFFDEKMSGCVELAGVWLRVPCPELLFLHAMLHLATGQTRLSTMVDIARLASSSDCNASIVGRLANEEGLGELADWALRETRSMTGLDLPFERTRSSLRARRPLTRLWLANRQIGSLAWLLSNAPTRRWAVVVGRIVWPDKDFLAFVQRTRRGHFAGLVRALLSSVVPRRAEVRAQDGGLLQ